MDHFARAEDLKDVECFNCHLMKRPVVVQLGFVKGRKES